MKESAIKDFYHGIDLYMKHIVINENLDMGTNIDIIAEDIRKKAICYPLNTYIVSGYLKRSIYITQENCDSFIMIDLQVTEAKNLQVSTKYYASQDDSKFYYIS